MLVRCLFIAVIGVIVTTCTPARVCPSGPHNGTIRFTTNENEVEYVRTDLYIELRCCGAGYNIINWFKLNKSTSHWDHYNVLNDSESGQPSPFFSQDNQTLNIRSATETDDGKYKCQLYRNALEFKERNITLHVEACDKLARGPIPVTPGPRDQYISNFGVNVTFPCAGYFGCTDETDMREVGWFVQDKVSRKWTYINQTGFNRYTTSTYTRDDRDDDILGVNLTITDVQPEDLETNFSCVLATPQIKQGETRFVVQLHRTDTPLQPVPVKIWMIVIYCVSSFVGLALLLIGVVAPVKHFYGPRINMYWRRLTGPDIIEGDEYEYNAFVFYNDDDCIRDREFAQKLKHKLEKEDLKICIEIDPHKPTFTAYHEAIGKSARVIFLYSDNLLRHKPVDVILTGLINTRGPRAIIFIELQKLTRDNMRVFQNRMSTAAQWHGAGRNGCPAQPQDNELGREENGDVEEGHGHPEYTNDLIKGLWRGLKRVSYPGEANKRREINFWCEIQNLLPRLRNEITGERKNTSRNNAERGNRTSSSARPLIEDASSPGIQANVERDDAVPVNVTYDDVFVFDPDTIHDTGNS